MISVSYNWKILIPIVLTSVALEGIFYLVNWIRSINNSERNEQDPANKLKLKRIRNERLRKIVTKLGCRLNPQSSEYFQCALFFPDSGIACESLWRNVGDCKVSGCLYLHKNTSLTVLCELLSLAKTQLDLCVYVITCNKLSEIIINAQRKGVVVRVIVDKDQSESTGTQIGSFLGSGIPVRWNSRHLMHHKYVVIDETILINGSFNWTRAAITGNHENLVVTTEETVVNSFQDEFEKLWEAFSYENTTEK